jgi:hypothetical protein
MGGGTESRAFRMVGVILGVVYVTGFLVAYMELARQNKLHTGSSCSV